MLGYNRYVEKFTLLLAIFLSSEQHSLANEDNDNCKKSFDTSQNLLDGTDNAFSEKISARAKQRNALNIIRRKTDRTSSIQSRNDLPQVLRALAMAGDPEFTVDSAIYKFFSWQLDFFNNAMGEYGKKHIDAKTKASAILRMSEDSSGILREISEEIFQDESKFHPFLEYMFLIADEYIAFADLEIRKKTHPFEIYIQASNSEAFRPKFLDHSREVIQYFKDRFSKYEIHEISLHLGNIFESKTLDQTGPNRPTTLDSMNRIEEKLYDIIKYKEETQLLLNIYFSRLDNTNLKNRSMSTRENFVKWLHSDSFKAFLTPENFSIHKSDIKNLNDINVFIGFNLASLASFRELRPIVKEIVQHHIAHLEDHEEYEIILKYIEFLDSIESSRDIYSFSKNIDFYSEKHKWLLHAMTVHLKSNPLAEEILKENRDRVFSEYTEKEELKFINLWISTVYFSKRNFHYRILDALEHPSVNIRKFTVNLITETIEDVEKLDIPERTKVFLGTYTSFPETQKFYKNFEYIVGNLPILDLLSILKENENITALGRRKILEFAEKIIPNLGIQKLSNNGMIHRNSIDENFENIHWEILHELLLGSSSPEEISVGLVMLFFAKKIPYQFSSKIPKFILASSPKYRSLIERLYSDPSVTERYLESFIQELKLKNLNFELSTFQSQIQWYREMLSFKQDSNHFKYSLSRNLLILIQMWDRSDFHHENIPEQVVRLLDQFDLWQEFKTSFKALSIDTQRRFAFYFSLFVQMSKKAQDEGLRDRTTKAIVLEAQNKNHPWAFKATIRKTEKKTEVSLNKKEVSNHAAESNEGESSTKLEEYAPPTLDDYLERGELEEVRKFLEKDSNFAKSLNYDQVTQILSLTKFKEFIDDVGNNNSSSLDANTRTFIETFLLEIPVKYFDYLSKEKKIHLLRLLAYAQHLKLKTLHGSISKTEQYHRSLGILKNLLQHSQDQIRNYSYDIMKNFIIDINYEIPDVLFEYFSGHFLQFILKNPSYSKTELLFLSKWFLKSTNQQQETLLSQILLKLSDSRSNADMEHMIEFIQSTKVSLDHLRKNKSTDYQVLEPWVLIYTLEAGFKLSRISMNMNYTEEENNPVLQEVKTGTSYFSAVLRDHLKLIKSNPLSTLVDFEHAKKSHAIQSSWQPEIFASKALESSTNSMKDRKDSRRTGDKSFFDPRDDMEKSAIFECINFELMHGRFVWVVDNQHTLGYDILSYDPKKKYFYKIEVKAKFSDGYQLSLTSNELSKADISKERKQEGYYVYLVDMDSLSNPNNKARVLFRYTGMTTDKISAVSEYKSNEKVFLVPKIELAKFLMNTTD